MPGIELLDRKRVVKSGFDHLLRRADESESEAVDDRERSPDRATALALRFAAAHVRQLNAPILVVGPRIDDRATWASVLEIPDRIPEDQLQTGPLFGRHFTHFVSVAYSADEGQQRIALAAPPFVPDELVDAAVSVGARRLVIAAGDGAVLGTHDRIHDPSEVARRLGGPCLVAEATADDSPKAARLLVVPGTGLTSASMALALTTILRTFWWDRDFDPQHDVRVLIEEEPERPVRFGSPFEVLVEAAAELAKTRLLGGKDGQSMPSDWASELSRQWVWEDEGPEDG